MAGCKTWATKLVEGSANALDEATRGASFTTLVSAVTKAQGNTTIATVLVEFGHTHIHTHTTGKP